MFHNVEAVNWVVKVVLSHCHTLSPLHPTTQAFTNSQDIRVGRLMYILAIVVHSLARLPPQVRIYLLIQSFRRAAHPPLLAAWKRFKPQSLVAAH